MSVPKTALIAITSYNEPFYVDGAKTGLFYGEALHPYHEFKNAGFEVILASETGTFGIDEHSLTLKNIKKASDVDPSSIGLFFASAGHASLFDYPKAKALQHIAEDVWKRGGIVSAVCHGPAILPGIHDESGQSIIANKMVTGFTTKGEERMKLLDKIKESNVDTIEDSAASVGATYVSPKEPFDDFSITDGRLVTGANPASARSTAEKAVNAFSSLQ